MRPSSPTLCFSCKHYVPGISPENDRGVAVCRAFPDGIPSEIINGGFDHREPFGNETVLFELAADADPSEVEAYEQAMLEIEKNKVRAAAEDFLD